MLLLHQPAIQEKDQLVTTKVVQVERCQVTAKVVMVEVFIKGRKQLLFNNNLLNAHYQNFANKLQSRKEK